MLSRARALALSLVIATTVFAPAAEAQAGGPSVDLPDSTPTPVTAQGTAPRPVDEATANALHGDQPSGPAPKDGGGTLTATPLAPSASWQVAGHTGTFSWTYPLRVPPAPGGLEPQLTFSYSSSTVDGRTSSTNNQASWIGDGWDLSPGFIERSYLPCILDDGGGTTPPMTGDLCWSNENATMALAGHGGQLIKAADGLWRNRADDGSRIEWLGDHWRVTTVDGRQYMFGSRAASSSTWTVPVFGDDAGEPCHGATFAASQCVQPWRWNLDQVIDPHGNMIIYRYQTENNSYGLNLQDTAVSYVRGGTLQSVEYGMRAGGTPSGRVDFTVADRCVPGSTCSPDRVENWPDVAWSQRCDTATCQGRYSPTFWSAKRLAKVTTKVWNGNGYSDVDSWELEHQFPDPGFGEKAALWLHSIVHRGHVGGNLALPAVTFEGKPLANRAWKAEDGLAPLSRYRLIGIVSESSGSVSIQYAAPDCVPDVSMPANPETNTKRCYPVRWAKPNFAERTDYFHKHVVSVVTQSDRFGGMSDEVTTYEYLDGAAWHYDMSEFTKPERRTWNDFRGFGRVRTHTGRPGDISGPVGMTEERYYRGMNGTVSDSAGGQRADLDWLAGTLFETATFDGESGPVIAKTITTPVAQGPLATRGDLTSYLVRPGTVAKHTLLESGQWRVTRVESTYDDRGLLTRTNDLGDVATTSDDRCITTTYARNVDKWILSAGYRQQTVSVACNVSPSIPADVISDDRTAYDNQSVGTAPTEGNVTRTESLRESGAYVTTAKHQYDVHGRLVETRDGLDRATTVAYTPATGGPAAKTIVTDAFGFFTTTTLAPAWGKPILVVDPNLRRTETAFDPLGRTTEIWLPSRKRGNGGGNTKFSYLIRNDGPAVLTAQQIGPKGNYITTKTIFDGLMRVRQVQAPAPYGGRLLTDQRYDSQGRLHRSTNPYYSNTPLDDTLWLPSDVDIPAQTRFYYDGVGRQTAGAYMAAGTERWRSTTSYGGDRVHFTPPPGGTPTTTITDARGQQVEYRQHNGSTYDKTTYGYTKSGLLERVTDPAGNASTYRYDLAGRMIHSEDVDKGVATRSYDDANQLITTTDARNVTLTYEYDVLGRRTALRQGSTVMARWTFDGATAGKRLPWTSVRYQGNAAYEKKVLAYNALNQPLDELVTIPETELGLTGSYKTSALYASDGTLTNTYLPALGDLREESILHTYDDLGLPAATNGGWDGQTFNYITGTIYTRYAEPARLQFGEGAKRAWLSMYYDDTTRRIKRAIVDAELPAPMQTDVNYTYNDIGLITSIEDKPAGQTSDLQCFRHDYLQRLVEAWTPGNGCAAAPSTGALGGPAPYWESYRADSVGNRTSLTRHLGSGDVTSTYVYPAAGQPKAHAVTSVKTGSQVEQYGYDAVGNMTSRPGQSLEWTADGRLSKVTGATDSNEFVYDADGNRLIRRDPNGRTLYLPGQELRAAGTMRIATRYYEHGGSPVAVRVQGNLFWLAADHQGTQQIAIDSANLTVSKRRQTPFGTPRGASVAFPGQKGFVGGTVDAGTGMTHIGARDYDPALGKFVSVDPVKGNQPQLWNAYSYSNNSPVSFSDPTGLYCDSCDYYAYTKGEDSVWTPETKRKSFCDSCEFYARRDGTHSAWNTSVKNKAHQPTVFDESEKINKRRAEEARVKAQREKIVEDAIRANAPDEVQRIIEISNLVKFQSGSICLDTSAALGVSVGITSCINWDSVGVTMSMSGRIGLELGAGGSMSALVRLNTDAAPGVGNGLSVSAEAAPKIFAGGGGGFKIGGEVNLLNGDRNAAIQIEMGVGAKVSFGGVYGNAGVNSGYLFKWCDIKLC